MALDNNNVEQPDPEVRVEKRDREGKAKVAAVMSGRSVANLNNSPTNERSHAVLEILAVVFGALFHGLGMTATAHILGVEDLAACAAIGTLTAFGLAVIDAKSNGARTADRVAKIAVKRAPDIAGVLTVNTSIMTRLARPAVALLTSALLATGLAMHHFDDDIRAHLFAKQNQEDVRIESFVRPEAEREATVLTDRMRETSAEIQRESNLDPRRTHDADLAAAEDTATVIRLQISDERNVLRAHETTRSEQARIADCERFGTAAGNCTGTSGLTGCKDRCRAAEIRRDQAASDVAASQARINALEQSLANAENQVSEMRANRPGKPLGLIEAEAKHQAALTNQSHFDLDTRVDELIKADPRRETYTPDALAHRLDALYELIIASPGFLGLFILIWLVAAMLESLTWVAGFFTRSPHYDDRAAKDLIGTIRANTRDIDVDYIADQALRTERRVVERNETAERIKIEDELETYKIRQMAAAEKQAFRLPNQTWLGQWVESVKARFTK